MTAGDEQDPEVDGLISQLKDNDIFSDFLDSNFNARDYANVIIEGQLIGESLSKLNDGIDLLDKELLSQVSEHHEDLLSQATGIETLEGVLHSIQARCQSLVKSVDRVKSQVTEPYNRIASRTRQLRRLQTTCEYLRRIIRILHLSKRLEIQMKAGSREITKAAQTLDELGYVVEGVDLTDIQVVEEDLKKIQSARVTVENQAIQMLEQGLNTQNQTLIGTSLQVFLNLGTLVSQVDRVIAQSTDIAEGYVAEAVSLKVLANMQGTITNSPNMGTLKTVLWEQIEKFMNKLHDMCLKIYTLEKVLSKKRDPVTHTFFIESFSEDGHSTIFNNFWNMISSNIRSKFDHATQESSQLKQAFEGEFPKLLRLFNDFWSKVSMFIENSKPQANQLLSTDIKVGFIEDGSSPLQSLKSALHPFENAYLSRSLSRLFDPVNLVFPNGALSVPSSEDLNSIIKAISSELNVAAVDERLMVLVADNVAKTIQLYATKCETILVATLDAAQLTGGLTNAQIRNVSIVNSLHQLRMGVAEILPNLTYPPQEAVNTLDESMTNLASFMDMALSLILGAIMSSMENKMARMHSENFRLSASNYHEIADTQPCSSYITDIQEFIKRVQSDYLSLYHCTDFLLERLELLAVRLMGLFIRHAGLLRDLSEGGKLKLAADMAQLEFTVTPLCRRFEDIGPMYKLFRAFRPLLFQAIEDIPSNPNLGESLPYSIVLHFLFSKAPMPLLSPHTVAGWTVPQYSEWLDEHEDEQERMALIRGTLEAYSQKMRAQGTTEFPVVYDVMMKLLEQQV